MNGGVYSITNTANGHRYIGSAVSFGARWRLHRGHLRLGAHANAYLQRAWNKHGEGAFRFEVLEEWEPEFLISMEQWWINMLCPEYNIAPVAGSQFGYRHTDETRNKLSAARKRRITTNETRRKMRASALGHSVGEETRRKISSAKTGHPTSAAARQRQSEAHRGKKLSDETRRRMSESQRARRAQEKALREAEAGEAG